MKGRGLAAAAGTAGELLTELALEGLDLLLDALF